MLRTSPTAVTTADAEAHRATLRRVFEECLADASRLLGHAVAERAPAGRIAPLHRAFLGGAGGVRETSAPTTHAAEVLGVARDLFRARVAAMDLA